MSDYRNPSESALKPPDRKSVRSSSC